MKPKRKILKQNDIFSFPLSTACVFLSAFIAIPGFYYQAKADKIATEAGYIETQNKDDDFSIFQQEKRNKQKEFMENHKDEALREEYFTSATLRDAFCFTSIGGIATSAICTGLTRDKDKKDKDFKR